MDLSKGSEYKMKRNDKNLNLLWNSRGQYMKMDNYIIILKNKPQKQGVFWITVALQLYLRVRKSNLVKLMPVLKSSKFMSTTSLKKF